MKISLKNKFDAVREQWIEANVKAALSIKTGYSIRAWINQEGEIELTGQSSFNRAQENQNLVCDVTPSLIDYTAEALADAQNKALLKLQTQLLRHVTNRKKTSVTCGKILEKLQLTCQKLHKLAEHESHFLRHKCALNEQILRGREYAEALGGRQLITDYAEAIPHGLVVSNERPEFELYDYVAYVRKASLLKTTQDAINNGFVVACGDAHFFRSSTDHDFIHSRRASYQYSYDISCTEQQRGSWKTRAVPLKIPAALLHAIDKEIRPGEEGCIIEDGVGRNVSYILSTPQKISPEATEFHIRVVRSLLHSHYIAPADNSSNPFAGY